MGSPELLLLILSAGGETGAEVIRGLSWGALRARHHRFDPVSRGGIRHRVHPREAGDPLRYPRLVRSAKSAYPPHYPAKLAAPPLASLLWSRAPDHNTLWLSNIALPFAPSADYIKLYGLQRSEDR